MAKQSKALAIDSSNVGVGTNPAHAANLFVILIEMASLTSELADTLLTYINGIGYLLSDNRRLYPTVVLSLHPTSLHPHPHNHTHEMLVG